MIFVICELESWYFELRNVVAKDPFEKSLRFPAMQPNLVTRDGSRLIHPLMRLLLSGGNAPLSAGNSSKEGSRAAMRMFAGLDVGFKRTVVCVVDEGGRSCGAGWWIRIPEALSRALQSWGGGLRRSAWIADQ